MPVSRREFLGSAAAAGGVVALAPAVAEQQTRAPRFDTELPIHQPEHPVEHDAGDPWGSADAEIINHGLPPEWRARFVYRLPTR